MEMYNQLDHEDQLAYHARADASKEALKEKPEENVVFECVPLLGELVWWSMLIVLQKSEVYCRSHG
jgi:hypothetical protein